MNIQKLRNSDRIQPEQDSSSEQVRTWVLTENGCNFTSKYKFLRTPVHDRRTDNQRSLSFRVSNRRNIISETFLTLTQKRNTENLGSFYFRLLNNTIFSYRTLQIWTRWINRHEVATEPCTPRYKSTAL
jgi:hypothetical protein